MRTVADKTLWDLQRVEDVDHDGHLASQTESRWPRACAHADDRSVAKRLKRGTLEPEDLCLNMAGSYIYL